MTLADMVFAFRLKHNISQRKMDELLGEHINTTFRIEAGYLPNKLRSARIENKLNELERKMRK